MDFIKENENRKKILFAPYNPVKGVGSPLKRFEFKIDDQNSIWLPMSMKPKWGSSFTLSEMTKGKYDILLKQLHNDRLDHDFEFWCVSTIKIKPKLKTGKEDASGLVPFKLNYPQRLLLDDLEFQRIGNMPIREIITKARQWGGSTMIQFYCKWIAVRHMTNWNATIIGDVEKQSKAVRAMYETAIKNYPSDVQKLSFKNFQNSSDWKYIPERNCTISIASMQRPDKIRSEDLSMAHLTEVGMWKKTDGKEPKDVVQSVIGTIPLIPYTLIALESTAKGVGNYFHTAMLNAISGVSGFRPFFLAWFKIEIYTSEFKTKEEAIELYNNMNAQEQKMWLLGCTLEGIKWYRMKLAEFDGDGWRMQSEFPSDVSEAFQSTGSRVFAPDIVVQHRKTCKPPVWRGDVFPSINSFNKGADALKNVELKEMPNGSLSIWKMPNDPPVDEGYKMLNRYAMFADIGGRTHKADYSVITVVDRYWMMDGGVPEAVMTWRGHLDQDLFAWKCAQLGMILDEALLAMETNSLRKNKNTEGDHFFTILNEISDHYPNLYTRDNPEEIQNGLPTKYGFHTNHSSKGMIINSYNALLRDRGYVEFDEGALNEADTFENKPDGSQGARDGCHDDILITRAGATWLATSKAMSPPRIVKISDIKSKPPKNVSSYANFG
jgi:hypothetical protein